MLVLAKAKHAEAIASVEQRPLDINRVRRAQSELDDAILLIEDCYELTGADQLAVALLQLKQQRALLAEGIFNLDRYMGNWASPWSTPWPWLSLVILCCLIAILVV